MKKGFSNKKLGFYASAKSDLNDKARYLSETNGFFNIRQHRNGTQLTGSGVASKSYSNYIRAKERAHSIAKDYFEKQNLIALNKAKNQKNA